MKYRVVFDNDSIKKKFTKALLKISPKKAQDTIMDAILELGKNPRPEGKSFKVLNPPIELYQFVAHYRLRIGDYRVLYDVDDKKKVVYIIALRKREEDTYK